MVKKSLLAGMRATLAATVLLTVPAIPQVTGTSVAKAAESVVSVSRSANKTQTLQLGLNKSIVVDLPDDAADILVANPEVADAVMRTSRRLYVFGKEVGTTNVFVFDRAGNQMVNLDLSIERDVAGLDVYLSRFIPNSNIKTEIINDNIVLTGSVQTPQDAAQAAKLAEIFVKGGDATSRGGNDFFSIFQDNGSSQIVNLLEITGGDQVTLKVIVAEIQRSVVKQLGINLLANRSGDSGISFSSVTDNLAGAYGKPLSTAAGTALGGALGGVNINAYFEAMEEAGVMKTLASPTLTAVSGEKAVFKVGGEYNVVGESDASGDGLTYTFDKIEYGIGLEFTPVVLSPGRISMRIRTSVSEPTTEGAQSISIGANAGSATQILSIRKRLADTAVELPSGGSMMIAGLIRDDVRQVVSGFPGLSKVPILGALFRSRGFVRNETELVIMVTPYLVRPVAESQLARPTDNFNPASDRAGNLLGRVNRIYGAASGNKADGRYHGAVGFIYK